LLFLAFLLSSLNVEVGALLGEGRVVRGASAAASLAAELMREKRRDIEETRRPLADRDHGNAPESPPILR
jgi:hypothetical protein